VGLLLESVMVFRLKDSMGNWVLVRFGMVVTNVDEG
jgi:hydrogenase maturation factor